MNSDTSDSFVAVVAILVVFGMPIAYLISHRFFAHQERMAMIQRGMTPPPNAKAAKNMNWERYYGPSTYQQQPAGYDAFAYAEWQAQRSLRKGITLAMIGFALLVGLSISLGPSGPWLLGGLIPLFVGIAQIIIALLGGARFGTFGPPPPPAGLPGQSGPAQYQQQQPGPFSGGRTVEPGPYAWRPGPTTELEKPPSPPDTRS
jgi:hypothetical protein